LSCRVPNLQLYAFIVDKNIFDFEIDSDSRIEALPKLGLGRINKAIHETGFADSAVADYN
jgi:hypothetical protein